MVMAIMLTNEQLQAAMKRLSEMAEEIGKMDLAGTVESLLAAQAVMATAIQPDRGGQARWQAGAMKDLEATIGMLDAAVAMHQAQRRRTPPHW